MKSFKKKALAHRAMTIDEYKDWCVSMWSGEDKDLTLRDDYIMGLGLPGEVGEVLELLKKSVRDKNDISTVNKKKLIKELGDVLYYLMMMCHRHGLEPSQVIKANVTKLKARYKNKR